MRALWEAGPNMVTAYLWLAALALAVVLYAVVRW